MNNVQWSEEAFKFLKLFVSVSRGNFMAEDIRYASAGIVPKPNSARAWGGVIRKAQKEGLIKAMGYDKVKNVKAHRTPAGLWSSNVVLE